MVEEAPVVSAGEFETVSSLIASSPSLQISLAVLAAGLVGLAISYFYFSRWIHAQKFYYTRPHLSHFVQEAVLPLFAIALVMSVSFYVYSLELFRGTESITESGVVSPEDSFAKILNTISILVVGYTVSRLIPIVLIKREKSILRRQDFEEWKDMHGFPDDPCYNCDHCDGKSYGVCENPPAFFHKVFKWVPPAIAPEGFKEEQFQKYIRTEDGRRFLENYYTKEGEPIGGYEPIVEDPFETWQQNEKKKYLLYYEFCVTGKNQSGRKLRTGRTPEEILPIDQWREERRFKRYSYVIPGIRRQQRKAPRMTQQMFSIGIFAVTALAVAVWWGIDLIVLATATGGLALGVGLALKETLENYFAYFVIRRNKIFEEGHRIKLENDYNGIVYRITPRVTYVRHSLNESLAVIPTRQLVNSVIINYTKEFKMVPATVEVGVSYLHDPRQVAAILVKVGRRAMREVLDIQKRHMVIQNRCPYLDENKPSCGCDRNVQGEIVQPVVRFRKFDDSSLNFALWVYAREYSSQFKIESEMRMIMHEEFKTYDIRIPWPIRTIYTGNQLSESKEISELDEARNKVIEEYGRGDTTFGGADDE